MVQHVKTNSFDGRWMLYPYLGAKFILTCNTILLFSKSTTKQLELFAIMSNTHGHKGKENGLTMYKILILKSFTCQL